MNNNNPNFPLGEIGQIAFTVSSVEQSVIFYRETLGLRHLFNAPPSLAFFAVGNVRLMLSQPEKSDSEHFRSVLYFKVADIQSSRDALVSRGVAFEAEPHLVARMPDHELWLA